MTPLKRINIQKISKGREGRGSFSIQRNIFWTFKQGFFGRELQHDFTNMRRRVKGRLNFFTKFIRFGTSPRHIDTLHSRFCIIVFLIQSCLNSVSSVNSMSGGGNESSVNIRNILLRSATSISDGIFETAFYSKYIWYNCQEMLTRGLICTQTIRKGQRKAQTKAFKLWTQWMGKEQPPAPGKKTFICSQ